LAPTPTQHVEDANPNVDHDEPDVLYVSYEHGVKVKTREPLKTWESSLCLPGRRTCDGFFPDENGVFPEVQDDVEMDTITYNAAASFYIDDELPIALELLGDKDRARVPQGASMVIDSVNVVRSHTRDPVEIPCGHYGADYVFESTSVSLTTDKVQCEAIKRSGCRTAFGLDCRTDLRDLIVANPKNSEQWGVVQRTAEVPQIGISVDMPQMMEEIARVPTIAPLERIQQQVVDAPAPMTQEVDHEVLVCVVLKLLVQEGKKTAKKIQKTLADGTGITIESVFLRADVLKEVFLETLQKWKPFRRAAAWQRLQEAHGNVRIAEAAEQRSKVLLGNVQRKLVELDAQEAPSMPQSQ
jgi:hypothetical protein